MYSYLVMKRVILLFLYIFHFYFLYNYGIAWFGTTLLFYYLLYIIFDKLIFFFISNQYSTIVKTNFKIIFSFFIAIEFFTTFVSHTSNNYMENEKGIYFSEYMRNEQHKLLKYIGIKNIKNAWIEGYTPNTLRVHKTSEFEYQYITNKIGFRGPVFENKSKNEDYSILVLGDSFVEGYGAPDSSTLPVFLENFLSNRNRNKNINVINGGICGSNPLYQIKLYDNIFSKYNPNLVIIVTNYWDVNDAEITMNQGEMSICECLNALSHIYRIFNYSYQERNLDKISIQSNLLNIEILKFSNKLKNKNIDFVCIHLPMIDEFIAKRNSNMSYYLRDGIEKGIPIINLKSDYSKIKNIKLYYWKKDLHHNQEGYKMMASIIAEKILIKAK